MLRRAAGLFVFAILAGVVGFAWSGPGSTALPGLLSFGFFVAFLVVAVLGLRKDDAPRPEAGGPRAPGGAAREGQRSRRARTTAAR